MAVIAVVSFVVGRTIGRWGITGLEDAIKNLNKDNLELTDKAKALEFKNVELDNALKGAKDEIAKLSSNNVYEIETNQSQSVPTRDNFTIGVVGIPGNQKVELNINDKRYSAAAGEVIPVSINRSLNCRIEVMSFNVIKAQVRVKATCAQQP
jgi:hypothetical protein